MGLGLNLERPVKHVPYNRPGLFLRQEAPMTPEEGGEGWSGKMFFRAWTAVRALFPSSRRHSQKFQTGLIVEAFRSQIVDKMQRKTVSWQRVVQVRDGIVHVTVLRHRVDRSEERRVGKECRSRW